MVQLKERLYTSVKTVLQNAAGGKPIISAMASPHEYVVVDHGEIRARSLATGNRVEPSSVLSYPGRGFAFINREHPFAAILPKRDSILQFAVGAQQVASYYELGRFEPIWAHDPLERTNGETPVDVFEEVIVGMAPDVTTQIRRLYPLTVQFALIQHANTPEGRTMQKALLQQGIETHAVFGEKSYEYPNIGDRSGFTGFARSNGLPAPYASVAMVKDEFVKAYQDVVKREDNNLVFMKLAGSGGGYAVREVRNIGDVMRVAAEWEGFSMFGPLYKRKIPVEFQAAIPGIEDGLTLAFQYSHGSIVTPPREEIRSAGSQVDATFTIQMMHGVDWIGNIYGVDLPIQNNEDRQNAYKVIGIMQKRFMEACKRRLGEAWNNATGGIDFALIDLKGLVENQKLTLDQARDIMGGFWSEIYDKKNDAFTSRYAPVIIEHNGLRLSDATPPAALAETIGIEKPYMATKILTVNAHLPEVWDYLIRNDLQLDLSQQDKGGIVPIAWIHDNEYGINYANVIIVPRISESLHEARERIFNELKNAGLIL